MKSVNILLKIPGGVGMMCAFLSCVLGFLAAPVFCAAEGDPQIVESQTDLLGLYRQKQHSRNYALLKDRELRVLTLPAEERFAAVWKPEGYASGRILVLLHGTGGAAYDGMKDELDMAEAYDLMLVGVQWHDARSNTYDPPADVYRRTDQILRYLNRTDGVPLTQIALSGFSRGGAISYEAAYRDLQSNKYFDLVIAHSGAIPPDGVVAPGESLTPGEFYSNMRGRRMNSGACGWRRRWPLPGMCSGAPAPRWWNASLIPTGRTWATAIIRNITSGLSRHSSPSPAELA